MSPPGDTLIAGREVLCFLSLGAVMLAGPGGAHGERTERRRIAAAVSYVSSGSFYFNAGRSRGLEVGDTVTVFRSLQQRAVGAIIAISSSSSSAVIVTQTGPLGVGDSVVTTKEVVLEDPVSGSGVNGQGSSAFRTPPRPESNQVSGRVALQYGAAGEFGKALDFSQPAAVVRLDIARLFGTGSTFTYYGRTYFDLSPQFARYGEGSRAKVRTYELSLVNDNMKSWYGWGLGRITSRFVGGLGAFDGGQVFVRRGNFSFGALAGAQADYSSSSIDPDLLKYAAFVNYGWGGDVFRTSDVTLAYGQQRYKGKIDRAFMYLQSSLRFGSDVFFYSSTELDFYTVQNGIRTKSLNLSNTFVTLSYMPTPWLSVNAGYDAARTIYLFESMRAISDTLLDKTLKEGYRASIAFRLPLNITVGGQGTFRLASGSTSSARTLGTSLRVSDILESEINLGVQYANIVGLYTEGNDITVDVDRWVAQALSVSFRIDRYAYSVRGQESRLVTTTAGGSLNMRVSRSLYAALTFDQVWDPSRDTQRLYIEVGFHF